jgi:uncharacterized protein (UPF0261 family)
VFYHPEINQVLFEAIKKNTADHVQVVEIDAHINDEEFSERAVRILLDMMEKFRLKSKN